MAGAQVLAPWPEVGVEVERGLRCGHEQPGGRASSRHSAGDLGVQAPAAGDALGNLCGLGEGIGGRLLDRRGRRGPDLADDAEQAVPQPVAVRAFGQPGGPDPPAAEREALAERGRHDGTVRRDRCGAEHVGCRVVHEITVDLVADDGHVIVGSDVAQRAHAGRPARRPVGLSGRVTMTEPIRRPADLAAATVRAR